MSVGEWLRIPEFWDVMLHCCTSGSWCSFALTATSSPLTQCHTSDDHNPQLHRC